MVLSCFAVHIQMLFLLKICFSDPHHFNSEAFLEGRSLILEGMAAIKANVRNENFQAARETLGRVLHTLQVSRQLSIEGFREKLTKELE